MTATTATRWPGRTAWPAGPAWAVRWSPAATSPSPATCPPRTGPTRSRSGPAPGWTLALDVPARTRGLAGLLGSLDRLVVEAGGRVYLAKDSRVPADVLAEMYPRLAEFRKLRAEFDPDGMLASDLSRRLGL